MSKVCVCDLVGRSLQLKLSGTETGKSIKDAVTKTWQLDPLSFRLLCKGERMDEKKTVESFLQLLPPAEHTLQLQLLKVDPLLDLGIFEKSLHKGIDLEDPVSSLKKTSGAPDSNNVFLRHQILEPCFCEFDVIRSRDEISFGVTYDRSSMEKVSGFGNLSTKKTWIFSKKQTMPVFLFGGQKLTPSGESPAGHPGVQEGDLVAVYCDPESRLCEFYCNSKFMGSTKSLECPLPESQGSPLFMYCMVDQVGDEVKINRFGPGRPY
ncbi:unnamed protein product [Symbiodinium sp. CCMP2456]|nr:unnamed protein product [Symbiodinium sp. CCMP2456]